MELKDTVEMMTSNNYKERFKAEYYQLKIRCEKLSALVRKYKVGSLPFKPTCSYEMLAGQLMYMESYLNALEKRAEVEEINLEE